jgi:hypothetical protein
VNLTGIVVWVSQQGLYCSQTYPMVKITRVSDGLVIAGPVTLPQGMSASNPLLISTTAFLGAGDRLKIAVTQTGYLCVSSIDGVVVYDNR